MVSVSQKWLNGIEQQPQIQLGIWTAGTGNEKLLRECWRKKTLLLKCHRNASKNGRKLSPLVHHAQSCEWLRCLFWGVGSFLALPRDGRDQTQDLLCPKHVLYHWTATHMLMSQPPRLKPYSSTVQDFIHKTEHIRRPCIPDAECLICFYHSRQTTHIIQYVSFYILPLL